MLIRRIDAYLIRAEVVKPYVTALEPQGMRDVQSVVLRLTTNNGLEGIGETNPHIGFTTESPETVMQLIQKRIGPALLGADATQVIALHDRMDIVVQGNPFAKAAFDIAAHDLLGKSLDVPVYQLLGGRMRDRVPMLWPIGGGTPEANAEEALAKMDEGYRSFHVKVGALTPDVDVARVQAVRQAVGPTVPMMIDANQGWDRSTAIWTIRRLEAFAPSMVEQPVPAWDIDGMSSVQARVDVPISADEAIDSSHRAIELIRRDAARVFSIKHGKMGGLLKARQIAAIAEGAGIPCFINSMIEQGISVAASLHLAATIPNLIGHGHALMSNLRMKGDVLAPGSFRYDGKDILIPEQCAGLGVEIDEHELSQRTIDHIVLES